jgi:hypothetical protein
MTSALISLLNFELQVGGKTGAKLNSHTSHADFAFYLSCAGVGQDRLKAKQPQLSR